MHKTLVFCLAAFLSCCLAGNAFAKCNGETPRQQAQNTQIGSVLSAGKNISEQAMMKGVAAGNTAVDNMFDCVNIPNSIKDMYGTLSKLVSGWKINFDPSEIGKAFKAAACNSVNKMLNTYTDDALRNLGSKFDYNKYLSLGMKAQSMANNPTMTVSGFTTSGMRTLSSQDIVGSYTIPWQTWIKK